MRNPSLTTIQEALGSSRRRGALRARLLGITAALSLFAAAVFASCGGGGETTGEPCDSVYAGKCGGACTADGDCAAGLYCASAGTCTADCAQGSAACPSGATCTPQGRCEQQGGPGGSGGSGGALFDGGLTTGGAGQGGMMDGCADISVTIEQQIPTVVLLIDQSGSMTAAFPGGNRWDVLRDALMNPRMGVVKLLENDVRFGLTLYSGADANPTCPLLADVPIALGNYDEINAVYSTAFPIEDTPTGESVEAVTAALEPFAEPGPKIIVLATDGEPDTCVYKDPPAGSPEAEMARQASIAAVQAAFDKEIPTFVIAVGDEISNDHLQDVANAGAGNPIGGPDNAKFYQPTDQQALIDAFNEIINGVRSCVFTLNGKVDPMYAAQGVVVLDGDKLGYNDPNGWQLNGESEIEIVGAACDKIQEGEHTLTVTFPCGTVIPR
jgi:hypothetical protein